MRAHSSISSHSPSSFIFILPILLVLSVPLLLLILLVWLHVLLLLHVVLSFSSCSQAVPLTELAFPSLSAFHLYFGDAGFEPRLETGSLTVRASWFSSLTVRASWFSSLPPYTFRTTSLDQVTNASFHIPSKSLPINHTSIRRKIFRDIKTVNTLTATP